jgi:hypothetical protein
VFGRGTALAAVLGAGVAVAALAVAAPAQAQLAGGIRTQVEALTFSSPEESGIEWISLLSTPWDASLGVGDWGAVSVRGNWALAHIEANGGASDEIVGLTDTEVMVDIFLGERALLSLSALAPTGKTELDAVEFGLSGILAAQSLPFSMAAWGTGGRVGADLVVDASPTPRTRVTLLTGYHLGREYEPLNVGGLQYRPGNQLNLRASVEQFVGRASLGLTLGFQNFGEDQTQGQNLFQAGNRFQAVASGLVPFGETGSAGVWASWTRRAQGSAAVGVIPVLDGVLDQPSQDLVQFGGALRLPVAGVVVIPEADVRLFRQENGVGEGRLSGLGVTAELPLRRSRRGSRLFLEPSLRARFGSIEDPFGNATGIQFYNASIGLRWEPGN